MAKANIVTGTIGSDCHTVGNWILSKALEEAGYYVTRIGACAQQEDFVDAAVETDADAVLVSSLYGMGALDCEGLRDRLVEAGKGSVLLYAGGKLSTGEPFEETEAKFKQLGFDRSYPPDVFIADFVVDLEHDLAARKT